MAYVDHHPPGTLKGDIPGHDVAAGASIPAEAFEAFLEAIKKEVSPILSRGNDLR